MPLTALQKKSLMVVRITSSIPSLIGAAYIVYHIVRSPSRRRRTSNRILLGMSTMDTILAFTTVSSNLPIPKGLGPNAIGNWASCEAFGFLNQGSRLSSVLYNGSLVVSYLLTIRYGFGERRIKKFEPPLHIFPLTMGWSTAIAGLPMELYNPTPGGCQINNYPFGCPNSVECIRAPYGDFYRFVFFLVPVWIVFFFLVIAMLMIYRKISQVEAKSEFYRPEHRFDPSVVALEQNDETDETPQRRRSSRISIRIGTSKRSKHNSKLQRRFAMQSFLYCLAFGATWITSTIATILREWITGRTYYPIVFLNVMLSSLAGFWNAIIYIRPRYLRYRQKQRELFRRQQQNRQPDNLPLIQSMSQALKQAVALDAVDDEDDLDSAMNGSVRAISEEDDGDVVDVNQPE